MAQAKVDEYFTTRKRNTSVQPSKRRKVVLSLNTNDSPQSLSVDSLSSYTMCKEKNELSTTTNQQLGLGTLALGVVDSMLKRTNKQSQNHEDIFKFKAKSETIALEKHQNSPKASKGRNKSGADKTETSVRRQPKVTELFSNSRAKPSLDQFSEKGTVTASSARPSSEIVAEEITSEWDDNEEMVLSTPRKRKINDETVVSKLPKTVPKQPKFTESEAADVIKTNLYSNNSASVKAELCCPIDEVEVGSSEACDDMADKEVSQFLSRKSQLLALVSEVMIKPPDLAVSPLLSSPSPSETKEKEKSLAPAPSIPKLLDKQKLMALKDRLKKCGKVSELKAKLGDLKKSLNEVKEHQAAKNSVLSEDKGIDHIQADRLPAFQRFQHLGEPGPPSLSLPYAFKILEENFQAMDQVVSMLHNRTEICTFSKLKVAVQNITRKNFEEKAVAQIKTVVPDAYFFRQEKNIPSFGQQTNSYQLTIEPNLQSEEASNSTKDCPKTSGGKPVFSASMLIKRKRWFSNNLLAYLKRLHKAFLATLNPPLEVPDDQLMRWHPKFQLDKVDVTPAPLPQSPDVKIYRTAKDVLENQRGKLNPMVEKALTKVVEKDLMANKNNISLSTNSMQKLPTISKSNQTNDSIKGIPPALLAKIRAKEAKKIEESLIRKPEEDNKLKIMTRLPEVIRTLRAIFVTEKKPALPLEDVCKKLEENFKNGISQRDVEHHVNMLRELAPELISVVEIKRGKYLKFDKNVDVQAVSSRIMNIVKSKK